MQTMKIRIRTKAPMILSAPGHTSVMTATQDFFSGSVLRGIFAARFIKAGALGNAAHEDADFMQLFYGGLRFVDAYPMASLTQTRAIPLPISMQRSKDGAEMCDLLYDDPPRDRGFKSMRGFAAICGKELYPVAVKKEIRLHMSRSDLNSDTDAKRRLAGRSLDSGIYNYEAITEGQSFEGMICGTEEQLRCLCEMIGTASFTCFAGRSKYTQYGLCEITLMQPEEIGIPAAPADDHICLRLETPFLPYDGTAGDARSMLVEIIAALNEKTHGGFSLAAGAHSVFARTEEIDNFVGVWGMRRPREIALGAGTVFAIEKAGSWQPGDMEAMNAVLYGGVGCRTEEGFGQLRLWDGRGLSYVEAKPPTAAPRELSKAGRRIAEQILLAHIIEQIRVLAAEDAEQACARALSDTRHGFARLENALGMRAQGARDRMRELVLHLGKNSALEQMLKNVKLAGHPLHAYLEDPVHDEMPYAAPERRKRMADPDLVAAAEELGIGGIAVLLRQEEVFYTYWNTFFRFARKAVGQTEKGGASA